MNFEFMTIGTPLPPCMPFPRALTGFPVSSTAKVMYCRMLDAMLSNGQEDENGILFICFPVTAIAAVLSRSPMTVKRVGYILANTLHHKSYDGRFSPSNKEWAEQVSTPEHNADRMTFRTDWVVDSHPAILDGFVTMFRGELEAQKTREQPFVKQFYVVENLQAAPLKIERFGNLDDAMSQYQALPNNYMKALGVEKNPDPLPGLLDILQCKNGIDTIVEDYKTVPGWDNPYIQNHVVQLLQGALAVQDVELAYELPDAYFHIQTCDDGFDYTLYNKDFLREQKPELLHHQKFLENGTAERAKESGTEQNYNMIDGCVNNNPKKPRIIGNRVSVLDRLHIKLEERKQKSQPQQQQQQERSRKS